MTKYHLIGFSFGGAHAFLFLLVYFAIISSDPQAAVLLLPFVAADVPISLIYLLAFGRVGGVFMPLAHPRLPESLLSPLLINGILGSIWWYFLPKFFLPKRLGGIWGRKPPK
jgi:hypothetical protein